MASVKLSAKTELTSVAAGDFLPIIDVSDTTDGASGTSKKITVTNLVTGVVSGSVVDTGSVQSITGTKTFTTLSLVSGTTSANAVNFGADVNLYRSAANELRTDDFFIAGTGLLYGGLVKSFDTSTSGGIQLSGASSGAYDVNLYASAANTLKTDDALIVTGNLTANGATGIILGAVSQSGASFGHKVTLLEDNPFYIQGAAATTGALFRVQDSSANSYLSVDQTNGVVINEQGADRDTRIEGDTDVNAFFVDASTDRVGVGTNSPTHKFDVNSDSIRLRTAKTPASAAATGSAGQIAWDTGFIYVCVATDTWKRVAIATW